MINIHESGENYLEAILMIRKRTGGCRSVDVARELGFSKPSVSIMMRDLRENGYIEIDAGNDITLTEKGQKIAESIYERHEIIAHMLLKLVVPEETAYADACKIEHDLSPITFEKIKLHYQAYSGK